VATRTCRSSTSPSTGLRRPEEGHIPSTHRSPSVTFGLPLRPCTSSGPLRPPPDVVSRRFSPCTGPWAGTEVPRVKTALCLA
jgi:hypothetical protein